MSDITTNDDLVRPEHCVCGLFSEDGILRWAHNPQCPVHVLMRGDRVEDAYKACRCRDVWQPATHTFKREFHPYCRKHGFWAKRTKESETPETMTEPVQSPTQRPSWDAYFLGIARMVSTRATCPRLAVGCVIARGTYNLISGYNGAVAGAKHCTEVGCDLVEEKGCQRVVHAEANAVAQAARHGVSIQNTTAYVTHLPCYGCARLLVGAGVMHVVYEHAYKPDVRTVALFSEGGRSIKQWVLGRDT